VAPSNFFLLLSAIIIAFSCYLIDLVIHRLRTDSSRIGTIIRHAAEGVKLLLLVAICTLVLGVSAGTFVNLSVSAGLPLQDAWLAKLDTQLGFDWIGLLTFVNHSPLLSWALVLAYHSTGFALIGVFAFLSFGRQRERLTEALALMAVTSLLGGIALALVPAAGAYTYFNPARDLYSNLSAEAGMWHYKIFMELRTEVEPVLDFNKVAPLVTFPSFHTIWGIIMIYVVREYPKVATPVLLLNSLMIAATLPEGGHYLVDLIAAFVITVGAIIVVGCCHRQISFGQKIRLSLPSVPMRQIRIVEQGRTSGSS
jgi:membrane-associated phospholipid phosphatase